MLVKTSTRVLLVFCIATLSYSCSDDSAKKRSEIIWTKDIPVIGSQSSPRATDLNNDNVLDIVIGAGKNEYQESDMGILAFDGKTGDLLWKQKSIDQVYGSATFYDVTGDNIKDVFIGGRSPQMKALDGKTGALLWEFKATEFDYDPILRYAKFNFNNSILVPDQNKDGLDDLLAINGGNSHAEPYSTVNRFPAVLMLLDSKTGKVITADTMPDGKESYMSPLCFTQPNSNELYIVFGTGGETIGGSLYLSSISELKNKNLRAAKMIASDTGHGFIAPAILADVTDDDYLDVIAISHGSKVIAIDGKNQQELWTNKFPGTESSNSFAAGYFTGNDRIPDFFTFISKGMWPNSTGTMQILLDGKNGKVAYIDSMGCTGFSSPVVYDINNDGVDEAIISINEFDCSAGYAAQPPRQMENKLIAINFKDKKVNTIDQSQGFKNIFSTPWIGDLDNNGYLDVINCQYFHHSDLLLFLGMRVKRIETPIKMKGPVLWGAFHGTNGDGIFKPENN